MLLIIEISVEQDKERSYEWWVYTDTILPLSAPPGWLSGEHVGLITQWL